MSNIDDKILFEPTGFEYQNTKVKVVIVGITPGNSQLKGDREGLDLREIKRRNAFAGSMRPNLVNMLDFIGVNRMLGIVTCRTLWDEDFDKVDMTSLLVEATYVLKKDGTKEMFRHADKIAKSEKLTRMLEEGFVKDCAKYVNDVLFVACGSGVYDVLKGLQAEGRIRGKVVGIAHPSGANMKCIQCYLGKKEPSTPTLKKYIEMAREAREEIKSEE